MGCHPPVTMHWDFLGSWPSAAFSSVHTNHHDLNATQPCICAEYSQLLDYRKRPIFHWPERVNGDALCLQITGLVDHVACCRLNFIFSSCLPAKGWKTLLHDGRSHREIAMEACNANPTAGTLTQCCQQVSSKNISRAN